MIWLGVVRGIYLVVLWADTHTQYPLEAIVMVSVLKHLQYLYTYGRQACILLYSGARKI